MHRTEGLNHLANLFTDGPPGTRIEEDWLNAVQEEIAYIIEQSGLTLKTASTETRQQLKAALDQLYFLTIGSKASRSRFTYNGAATAYTIKLSNGAYRVKDKVAKWVSELTTGAIAAPVADTRYYLYLDYSEIVAGTDIVAGKLVWSTTAPTYNQTYGGWYNGDDLCIFGVVVDSAPTNILPFIHDGGDLIYYVQQLINSLNLTPSDTWTDVDLSNVVPAFVTRAFIIVKTDYIDTASLASARPNGETLAHSIGYADIGVDYSLMTFDVMTDTSQIIEVRFGVVTAGNRLTISTLGWFFPIGM